MGKGKWVVGTDIGGTFTDVIGVNLETGEQRTGKVSSTQPTFSAAGAPSGSPPSSSTGIRRS